MRFNKIIPYLLVFVISSLTTWGFTSQASTPLQVQNHQVLTCFTPNKKCQAMIISALSKAEKNIFIHAYSLTDPLILNAMKDAKKRGVKVKLLVDKAVIRSKEFSMHGGEAFPDTRIDHVSGLAHNKIMIIDGKIVITGSYNFSKAAYSRNAENILFITSEELAKEYVNNFNTRWEKALG